MSLVQWLVIAGVAWFVLAVILALVMGPILKRNRRRYPKPPHVDPGRIPRQRDQQWPLRRKGHDNNSTE